MRKTRGTVRADLRWKLYWMAHNLGKILRYAPQFA
jgi:hypothetical protein